MKIKNTLTSFGVFFFLFAISPACLFGHNDFSTEGKISSTSLGESSERKITINFDRGHPFMGLGAVIWPGSPFSERRLEVMTLTNMTWVRIPLMNYFKLGDYVSGMSVDGLLVQRAAHGLRAKALKLSAMQLSELNKADVRTTERYGALAEEMKKAGVRLIVAALPAPPKEWMQEFRSGGTVYKTFKGGQPGQTDHRRDYINLLVAEISAARQAGLHIDAVEFPGEPDMPASGMRPDVANSMVGIMRKVMNGNKLSTVAIFSPGTAVTFAAPRYIDALQSAKGNSNLVKYFSVHDYDMVKRPAPSGLSSELLSAINNDRPVIVTEFGDQRKRWNEEPYSGGPKHTSREEGLSRSNAVNHSEYGVSAAGEGLKLVGDGALGLCIWQMNDLYWMDSAYGLIDLQGNVRPVATAFATFMKLLDRRAEIHSYQGPTGPGVAVTAFTVDRDERHQIVVAIANVTKSPTSIELQLVGRIVERRLGLSPLAVVTTYPEAHTILKFKNNMVQLLVPPDSLVVLSNSQTAD